MLELQKKYGAKAPPLQAKVRAMREAGYPEEKVERFIKWHKKMEDTYEEFAASGKVFRSVYTSGGGTDDNNQALTATLKGRGISVSPDFDDASLHRADLTIGWSPSSHFGTLTDGRAFSRWLVESGLPRSPLAPPELVSVLSDGSTATVTWRADRGGDGAQYVVEGSDDGRRWDALATTTDLTATVDARPWIQVRQSGGAPSDRYAGNGNRWLVVDGFDRILGGSWTAFTHDFGARVGSVLGASTASNEEIGRAHV